MKIGFDISQTGGNRTGCGFYADTLIRSLASYYSEDKFYLYKTFGTTYWDPDYRRRIPKLSWENCIYPQGFKNRQDSFNYWGDPQSVDESRIGFPDIVHSNNFSSPRLNHARLVYTVYDLSFIDVPECTTEENRNLCFNGMLNASLWADMAIAISHYSRKRFLDNFPHFPAERVMVAHLGNRLPVNGPITPVLNLKSDQPFFLAVGTLEPRKNLRRLLAAYREYAATSKHPKLLVLAGGSGWLEGDLESYIEALQIRHLVKVLGYVSDSTLRWLYQHCWAFIYPSLYEGFGLPVLEAMAAGAATISSNTTSLPEVGGDAVLYVDPLEEESILAAMKQIDEPDCRYIIREKCRLQAKSFSWLTTAKHVHDAYEQVLRMVHRNQLTLVAQS